MDVEMREGRERESSSLLVFGVGAERASPSPCLLPPPPRRPPRWGGVSRNKAVLGVEEEDDDVELRV